MKLRALACVGMWASACFPQVAPVAEPSDDGDAGAVVDAGANNALTPKDAGASTTILPVRSSLDWTPDSGMFASPDGGTILRGVVGWYAWAFEHMGFTPDSPGLDVHCSEYFGPSRWWANLLDDRDLPLGLANAGGGNLALYRVDGYVIPGTTGHMSAYVATAVLTRAELMLCESVDRMPYCFRPRDQNDWCATFSDVAETSTRRLERIESSDERLHYELHVENNLDIPNRDAHWVMRFSIPTFTGSYAKRWTLADVQDLSISATGSRFPSGSTSADVIEGAYVLYFPSTTELAVSIRAVSSTDGERFEIWGRFTPN